MSPEFKQKLEAVAAYERRSVSSLAWIVLERFVEKAMDDGRYDPDVLENNSEAESDESSGSNGDDYQKGDKIRIIKTPKSRRSNNLVNQTGTLVTSVGKGKWAIALDNGGNTELPEAYIEKTD
jgi:hypothetical protein